MYIYIIIIICIYKPNGCRQSLGCIFKFTQTPMLRIFCVSPDWIPRRPTSSIQYSRHSRIT